MWRPKWWVKRKVTRKAVKLLEEHAAHQAHSHEEHKQWAAPYIRASDRRRRERC